MRALAGGVTSHSETMEDQLLSPSERKKKTRRWGSLKRYFRRGKNTADSEDSKYFATLKEGDEQDHTTVNLSHSGSNPYSVDGSYDNSSADRATHTTTGSSNSRRPGTPAARIDSPDDLESTDLADALGDFNDLSEASFAQFDVPNMQPQRACPSPFLRASVSASDGSPSVYRTRSTLDQRFLNDAPPQCATNLGMEVILFDQEDDLHADGIFLSFQSPVDDWHDPLHTSKQLNPSVSSAAIATRNKQLGKFKMTETIVPESPAALSQQSESLAWVSHDEEDGDERPVKEIIFPTLATDDSTDAIFLDIENSVVDADGSECARNIAAAIATVSEVQAKPNGEANLWNTPPRRMTSTRSAFSPQSSFAKTPESVALRVQSHETPVNTRFEAVICDRAKLPLPSFHQSSVLLTPRGTPSAAFIKRKSAFSGEDLLSREAESFAEFLEEKIADESMPSPIRNELLYSNNMISTEKRLLVALTVSIDSSDEPVGTLPALPNSAYSAPLATSSGSQSHGTGTFRSATSISKASSALFSKSVSYDTSFEREEETADNASTSDAASTFAPSSSFPGSLRYRDERNAGNYCGGMFTEDDDDDLTLASEDFSSQKYRHSRRTRKQTPLLDQVRMDLVETVQELAREGSSVVMKFLQNKK